MPLPFDATLKDLARDHPRAYLTTFDAAPTQPVKLLNVDLSTVTTAADVVFGLGDPLREIVHLDFQASAAAGKHADVLVYNALLYRQYQVPVHSIVVLLRPKAAHPNLMGTVEYAARPGRGKMDFGYEVVRLWEIPADDLLAGDAGTAPLATLGKLPPDVSLEQGLKSVVERLVTRLLAEEPTDRARRLVTAAFVLTGMRVTRNVALKLFQGVRAMQESDTYLYIQDEGRIAEAKKIILMLGKERFGPPNESIHASLTAESDLDRLEHLSKLLLKVANWDELMATH